MEWESFVLLFVFVHCTRIALCLWEQIETTLGEKAFGADGYGGDSITKRGLGNEPCRGVSSVWDFSEEAF